MEETLVLNEAFDSAYAIILENKLNEDLEYLRENYEETQSQFIDSLNIFQEAFNILLEKTEKGETEEEPDKNKNKTENKNGIEEIIDKKLEKHNKDWANIMDTIATTMSIYDQMQSKAEAKEKEFNDKLTSEIKNTLDSYKPVPQLVSIQTPATMSFPQNIIFIIKQIIVWIKNNVINFIDRFTNIVRTMLGLKASETKYSTKDLKLNFTRAKEIETKYFVDGREAYKVAPTFTDALNNSKGRLMVDQSKTAPVRIIEVKPEDIKVLPIRNESLILTEAQDNVKVITLDTTNELFQLRQSLQHFFDLFDNAFGSNDENLFNVDDLKIMLKVFENAIESVDSGKSQAYEVNGKLSLDVSNISADKIKANLLRTKINTDNLKRAYLVTNQQINNIAKIIMNKNLLGISSMGVQYAMLSSATYETMIEISEIIDKRLKEAASLEKKLQKMKTAYEELVKFFEKKRVGLASIRNYTFTTIAQKRVNELYDAARYMSQTIQLRLSTLALFVSELNDTRAIIKNLNAINIVNKKR